MGEPTENFNHQDKAYQTESRLSLLALSENENGDLLSTKVDSKNALSRLASVYSDTLSQVPGKLLSTVSDDLTNNVGGTAIKLGIAGGIGLGSALLLARSPVAAKTLLSGIGIATTAVAAESTLSFSAEALSAESSIAQKKLADDASSSIARLGADLIETAPGLMAGAKLGLRMSPKIDSLNSLANSIQSKVEFPLRTVVPERLHFLGTDTKTISSVSSERGVNLFKAADNLAQSTPWRGVEDARILKLDALNLKASARLPGTQHETFIGGRKDFAFHTHESNILPSSADFISVRKAGIVSLPKEGLLVFHEGKGVQAEEILRLKKAGRTTVAEALTGELESNTMATLVLDPKRELAVGVNLRWSGAENRMIAVDARPVKYVDAVNNLSRFTDRLNIEALESPTHLLTKPGMYKLLQRIRGY